MSLKVLVTRVTDVAANTPSAVISFYPGVNFLEGNTNYNDLITANKSINISGHEVAMVRKYINLKGYINWCGSSNNAINNSLLGVFYVDASAQEVDVFRLRVIFTFYITCKARLI